MNFRPKQITTVTFSVNYHVYYVVGGSLLATLEARSRIALLAKMKQIRDDNKHCAELVTFEGIKKTVEVQEAKGKYTVFRPIKTFISHFSHKSLRQFYNEV